MTEFWKSNKKFWCEYCKIFITDNKISRKNHETGLKHKDRVQQFLRNLHKKEEEKKIQDAETMAMLSQIEAAAHVKMAKESMGSTANVARSAHLASVATVSTSGSASSSKTFYAQQIQGKNTLTYTKHEPPPVIARPPGAPPAQPAPRKVVATTGLGEWETVEVPVMASTRVTSGYDDDCDDGDDGSGAGKRKAKEMTAEEAEAAYRKKTEAAEEEIAQEEDGENLFGYKLQEKRLQVADDGEVGGGPAAPAATFKKRKVKKDKGVKVT
ncbi:hypothetical protein HK101_010433 [Irineochytrium annulatum]|nr:hypothetical protein HK101_010433 [Irineochytrium annulatum]